jgi:hypothetical protein
LLSNQNPIREARNAIQNIFNSNNLIFEKLFIFNEVCHVRRVGSVMTLSDNGAVNTRSKKGTPDRA